MNEDNKEILHKDQSIYKETAADQSMEALVAAKSRTLEIFSRDVSQAIIGLEQ